MAEVLGIVTGALQLVETAIKLTKLAADVKNAPSDIQLVLQTLEAIQTVLDDLDENAWTNGLNRLEDIVRNFRDDLIRICDGLKEYTGYSEDPNKPSRVSNRKKLKWVLFGSKDYEAALLRLEQYKTLFTLAISGNLRQAVQTGFQILQEKQKQAEQTANTFKDLLEKISEDSSLQLRITQKNEEKKERHAIEAWLSSLDYRATQSQKYAKHYEGTGKWVLEDARFKDWKAGSAESSTLWCYGKAGAGKSIVTSVIINHLEEDVALTKDSAVVYIYCNYKEQDARAEDYLACILKQLIQIQSAIPDDLRASYKKHNKQKTRPKLSEIATLLRSTAETFEQIYVVVDALDECKTSGLSDQTITRSKLIGEIRKLTSRNASLLVTSRAGISQIQSLFDGKPSIEIKAQEDDLNAFISGYITSNNARLARKLAGNAQLKQEITEKVVEIAQGMFLLAELLLDYIGQQHTIKRVQSALETLPGTLDSVYDKAIDRIQSGSEEDSELAMKVLAWVALSFRPLTVDELREALAACEGDEDNNLEFDRENIVDEEDILDHCEGLVTLGDEGELRFIHQSLQEYLLGRTELFSITEGEIAKASIRYLCSEDIAEDLLDGPAREEDAEPETKEAALERQKESIKKYHFISYAAHHWGKHAAYAFDEEGSDDEDDQNPNEQLYEFIDALLFENERALLVASIAVNCLDEDEELDTPFEIGVIPEDGSISALHVAAWHGLTGYVVESINRGYDVNLVDEEGHTALAIGAYFDHENVVSALLQYQDIDIHIANKNGMTPLKYAADNLEMLKLFQQYGEGGEGFDINGLDEDGETTLTTAALDGDISVVHHLLQNSKIELNKPNINGDTALICAIIRGNYDVVEALLALDDIDVNLAGEKGYTPLAHAATQGDLPIIEMLFDRDDLDVNKATDEGYTAIHIAAEDDYPDVVAALLDKRDTKLDLKTDDGLTALDLARRSKNYSIVSMLKNAGRQGGKARRGNRDLVLPRRGSGFRRGGRQVNHDGDDDEEDEDEEEEEEERKPIGRRRGNQRRKQQSRPLDEESEEMSDTCVDEDGEDEEADEEPVKSGRSRGRGGRGVRVRA